ncbi:hypothetical protein GLAREA_02324 [Glarea lozoyensis ATCC 20868]|uniref:Mediator of RNA polymerase II transcription subunit 31 n=1 Tax=Glarea lozoyensis (strain ATCC 20868 / MF5171) TaxID=1116229 RepID=S3D2Y2_GLAL2|nr:uncharacterized protein GLAREA_02324 [Glarea lozoyensis ATCC 20868]EPE26411.1 hypothetical protein GLAREA_02324 [Glarea lozoyensis ATCC 20868]
MTSPPPIPPEPKFGGFTRFEIELEFVQSLASPTYLNHLASQKYLEEPAFVAYLKYLQYWTQPPYLKYLMYPGPTLKHLELLQQERFRREIIDPGVMMALMTEGSKAAMEWPGS